MHIVFLCICISQVHELSGSGSLERVTRAAPFFALTLTSSLSDSFFNECV